MYIKSTDTPPLNCWHGKKTPQGVFMFFLRENLKQGLKATLCKVVLPLLAILFDFCKKLHSVKS